MATLKTIKDELRETLLANATLKAYINGVILDGIRESLVDYPCLIIEPISRDESDITYNTQRIVARFAISGFIKVFNPDEQLDQIFDFENMVLTALGDDRRLDENAEIVRITQTVYEFELYPVRNFTIQVDVEYRQNSSTRT
jgi:hypothetical protein